MKYNLWDVEIGKYLGEFDREEDALADVRVLIDHHGLGYAESLALGRVDEAGAILEPLAGMELAERARAIDRQEDERQPTAIGSRRIDELAAPGSRTRSGAPAKRRDRV